MKVLFLESSQAWINGLPNGFKDLGHDVRISGELTEDSLSKILSEFKPDLVVAMAISNEIKPRKIGLINKYIKPLKIPKFIISMGWTKENTGNKVEWIRKAVKKNKIPHIYWATEDPTHTFTFTLPLIKKMQPDFIFTICKERVNPIKILLLLQYLRIQLN